MNTLTRLVALIAVLCLAGCQELQGPTWSPDGQLVAYTVYTGKPFGSQTSVYLVNPESELRDPVLVAENAACPHWVPDGPALYLLGQRNVQGFYASVLKYKPGKVWPEGALETAYTDPSAHLVNLQLTTDGSAALLCSASDSKPGTPQRLDYWNIRDNQHTALNDLGDVFAPALTPDGRTLAFCKTGNSAPDGKPFLAILEMGRTPLQPKAVFPTADQNEPTPTGFISFASPDSKFFIFYAPEGNAVWSCKVDGTAVKKAPLPAGCMAPVVTAMAQDSKSAYFTLPFVARGAVRYVVYELKFGSGQWQKLDGESPMPWGGHAQEPRFGAASKGNKNEARMAWISPAGLCVGLPGAANSYYPQTAQEYYTACYQYLDQKDGAKALLCAQKARDLKPSIDEPGALDWADARAYLISNQGTRAAESIARAILLYPAGTKGLRWSFPYDTGILPECTLEAEKVLKDLDAALVLAPNEKLLPPLKEILASRLKGDATAAKNACRLAERLCASEDMVGGVRFQEGLALYESGDMVNAGERFEGAARTTNFPQRDIAAGMAAIAFTLDGRPASITRADTALRLAASMTTPLKQDFNQLLQSIKAKNFKQTRLSEDAKSSQGLRCWVEIKDFVIPQYSREPQRFLDLDRQPVDRMFGAKYVTISEINVAGLPEGTKKILTIPRMISVPVFSPTGDRVAFLAQGEIFPRPDGYCAAFSVDLNGQMRLGNKADLSGRLASRQAIATVTWSSPTEVTIKGNEYDAFGNETQIAKAISVP